MTSQAIRFSIVIPTRNRARRIKRKVIQLSQLTYPKHLYEIIVIDNASSDHTNIILKQLQMKIHNLHTYFEPRLGPAYARNSGIAKARYDHIIFTDDDTSTPQNFLRLYNRMWKLYPNVAAIGGRVVAFPFPKRLYPHWWCFGHFDLGRSGRLLTNGEFIISANMSIKKTMRDIHFNQQLGKVVNNTILYGEDYELSNRLLLSGKKVRYAPEIKITNFVSPNRFSVRYIARRYFISGVENYILDNILTKKFGIRHETFKKRFFYGLWQSVRLLNWRVTREFFHSMFDLLTIISYFFFAPFIYKQN